MPPTSNNAPLVSVVPTYFTTILLDISILRVLYTQDFFIHRKGLNIGDDEFEASYDWMVTEAINQVLILPQKAVIVGHHRHDIYLCLYDHFKELYEIFIRGNRVINNIEYAPGTQVKLLVAGPHLYLIKQGVLYE